MGCTGSRPADDRFYIKLTSIEGKWERLSKLTDRINDKLPPAEHNILREEGSKLIEELKADLLQLPVILDEQRSKPTELGNWRQKEEDIEEAKKTTDDKAAKFAMTELLDILNEISNAVK